MESALQSYDIYTQSLKNLDNAKNCLISTINAHSFNVSKTDSAFRVALKGSDVLIPDGVSIVLSIRLLNGKKIKKIAGADLFYYELNRLQTIQGKCFFLGSSDSTLQKIKARISVEYPNIKVETYSPPYKPEFTAEENAEMLAAIKSFQPDVLFIGMTAPKQEKWAYINKSELIVGHICCIGAVFDFYAGTVKRAPKWMIKIGLEWFYRLVKEPKRLWKRYLLGNTKFVLSILKEKIGFMQHAK